jgi:hypothetical protein
MNNAYLIVLYYPESGKSYLNIYSEYRLSSRGEIPLSIIIDQEYGKTYDDARQKLINRITNGLITGNLQSNPVVTELNRELNK